MNKLRALRKQANLSQDELADRIGVHKYSLVRYQNGSRKPGKPVKRLLALALGVSEQELEEALSEEMAS